MYGIIYYALNKANNKVYVGQTVMGLVKRKAIHYCEAKRNKRNSYFYNALKKYKDWEWNILQFAYCKAELDALEKYWMWVLSSIIPNGYNTKEGGANGKMSGKVKEKISKALIGMKKPHRTEEHKRNMSKALTGRKLTKEHCKNISEGHKGIIFTKEHIENLKGKKPLRSKKHRENIGKGNKGKIVSEEACKRMSIAQKGHVVLKETRNKISKALTGRKLTKGHCKNMSEALKNRKLSERVCKKMSMALTKKWQNPEYRKMMLEARKS